MLINGLKNANGDFVQRFQPQVVREVISPRAARAMTTALKTVPTKDGTAPKAELEHYTVAGKTGTAQVPGGPTGYLPQRYVSSFIGFFPADEPEVCVSVLIEEPEVKKGYYGGTTAAPFFKTISEQVANYLKIRPDRTDPLVANPTNAWSPNTVSSRQR
jgi:cell division protein FtsI/penicillin-binding protein 2